MKLIERDDSLTLLNEKFSKLALGEGHCFFVEGEAGIGKTTLVKTFLKQKEKECMQYTGACDSLFTPRPLAPLYDLSAQIDNALASKIQSGASRAELFADFFHVLSHNKKPFILLFEDVHWADEATFDFIKFFARRISLTKCMFILTCRHAEMGEQYDLRNVMGDLAPDTFTRITLSSLSKQAVHKMATEKAMDPESVYRITGGNPFYVNEVLASYSYGVPNNIKDSILSIYNSHKELTKNVWQILSVIPEGMELYQFSKIEPLWQQAIDNCLHYKVLIIKDDRIIFKHELYRRTIEDALTPFERIALNKKLLNVFVSTFEEKDEVEKIVHYAVAANENKLVALYAPRAAEKAARLGSHAQAAKLFLLAIEHTEKNNRGKLVRLYEAYSYECYLINRIKEAIIYQQKALQIYEKSGSARQVGNALRFLSRFMWFDGNYKAAEEYGKQAVEILLPQVSSSEKAMALSNMSQLKLQVEEISECIKWGNMAIEIARAKGDDEILCHALNNVGTAEWKREPFKEKGKKFLFESLDIALKNSFHEHTARAYSNIVSNYLLFREYGPARRLLLQGLTYCRERDLDFWTNYMLCLDAKINLDTGEWKQAASVAETLLANEQLREVVKLGANVILGTIKMRNGDANALSCLKEAKKLAFATGEYQRIIKVMTVLLEFEWLTEKLIAEKDDLDMCIDLVKKANHVFLNSEFVFWLGKARKKNIALPALWEPFKFLKAGKIKEAADFWESIHCSAEKGYALYEGNEDDKKNALMVFQRLGASVVCDKIKKEMRSLGIKKIPRGKRESTKTNLVQLTARELDVLQLLNTAARNKEIAETLYISPKTVDHHVSSILLKLNVDSRSKAVSEAIRLGVLPNLVH